MEKILVAHDGSDVSNRALLEGAKLAQRFAASLTVVSAIPNLCFLGVPVDCSTIEQVYRAETEGILEGVKAKLREQGIVGEMVVLEGNPADVIVDYAREKGMDVIVVGSTGKHATRRTILGSVSSKIIAHAPCQVLVVR
jgi:nucleotide-binding universal stress UspA family protein